jgi:IS1 family transposase
MNQLPLPKRGQIINLLVEGTSLRATSRTADVSINTVTKLLVEVGQACEEFHNASVQNLNSKRIQADEIWSFVYAKNKNVPAEKKGEASDVWTWTALDPDSKLIVSWFVGDRSQNSASIFMKDCASRIATARIQMSADGNFSYATPIGKAFHWLVDHGMVTQTYGTDPDAAKGKYSPAVCTSCTKKAVHGNPDTEHVSTFHVERQNLTMRMHMRGFTRLTNGFSKKIDNHMCAIALHFVYYNFAKVHKTLRATPAMEAGLTKKPMTIEEIVKLAGKEKSYLD